MYYKKKNEKFLVIFIVIEKGNKKELKIELEWNSIKFRKKNDEKFPKLFELNLNEINYN